MNGVVDWFYDVLDEVDDLAVGHLGDELCLDGDDEISLLHSRRPPPAPDDWTDEKRIVDAEAKKPDDWDDEDPDDDLDF